VAICGTLVRVRGWIAFILLAGAAHGARQPWSAEDIWSRRTVSDARISPDGQWVLWVESWNDKAANKSWTNLWLASTDGKERKPYTEGNWHDSLPRWSSESDRVAWISERDGRVSIRIRTFPAGAESEIPIEQRPLALQWSPDGTRLAFVAATPAPISAPWAPPAILERLRRPDPVTRLYVVTAKGGAATAIGPGGIVGEPSWMPDGLGIVVVRESSVDLVHLPDGATRSLIATPARYRAAVAAPDGSKIAYVAATARTQSYATGTLYVMNADGSRGKLLAGQLDRDVAHPQWSSDSRTVYFVADDRGYSRIYAARNEGTARQVTNGN
jgi:Tol biopolymer transport system component